MPSEPLFPTTIGRPMSRDAIERRLSHHVRAAAQACPSLNTKKVSAHTLRHTAMRLLLSGVDVTVIALWLGHEQLTTTNVYLHADMSQKERTSDRPHHTTKHNTRAERYHAPDWKVSAAILGSLRRVGSGATFTNDARLSWLSLTASSSIQLFEGETPSTGTGSNPSGGHNPLLQHAPSPERYCLLCSSVPTHSGLK